MLESFKGFLLSYKFQDILIIMLIIVLALGIVYIILECISE
jgi:hypothetical protein